MLSEWRDDGPGRNRRLMALMQGRRVSADDWRGVLRPGQGSSGRHRLWRD
jgi:hypothetical protein